MSNEIPRRIRIDLFTRAEKAIWDAAQAVEALPPDERLTSAGILLSRARDLVADFVDGVPLVKVPLGSSGVALTAPLSPEMIAAMTPEERSRFTARAPSLPLGTTGVTATSVPTMPLAGMAQGGRDGE